MIFGWGVNVVVGLCGKRWEGCGVRCPSPVTSVTNEKAAEWVEFEEFARWSDGRVPIVLVLVNIRRENSNSTHSAAFSAMFW